MNEKTAGLNGESDHLLAMVSHELRSSTSVILGAVSLIRQSPKDSTYFSIALDMVERHASFLYDTVENIYADAYDRMNPSKIEYTEINFSDLVNTVAHDFGMFLQKKEILLKLNVCNDCFVRGNNSQMRRVLHNLLTNAIKFTPPGGLIDMQLHSLDNRVSFVIADSGKGIEPERLSKVFNKFERDESFEPKGFGIGLYLAKGIVESHSGIISVASDGPGRGATFTVTLPRLR